MAAPITHIVLADKVFDKYFPKSDKKQFYVGTSFPDIRYLGVIDRERTHFSHQTLKGLVDSNTFIAGAKFHSLVDEVREKYMKDKDLYSYFPGSKFLTQAVKIFEDRVLYGEVRNWDEITHFFDGVQAGELKYDLSEKDIERWHVLLRNYFSQPPNADLIIKKFISDMGRPEEMSDEIIRVLGNIKHVDTATKIVKDFYNGFESLINNKITA